MLSSKSLQAAYKSATTWVTENSTVATAVATAVCAVAATRAYTRYQQLSVNDEEERTNIDYPAARRLIMAKTKTNYPDDIQLIEEYLQMPDGNLIFTRCYIPKDATKIKGMICSNHGYKDYVHCLFHRKGIKWAQQGFIFFAHEHLGHGRSDGLYIYCPDFSIYTRHASYVHAWAKTKYSKLYDIPNDAYFLFGTSMGGAITILESMNLPRWMHPNLKDEFPFKGMVLLAPMCSVDPNLTPPAWVVWIFRNLIVPLAPKAHLSPVAELSDWLFSPEAPKEHVSLYFESVENELQQYQQLPRLITSKSLLEATEFIDTNAAQVTIPFLLVHNKNDKVTNPNGSKQFFKSAGSKDKELKMYDKGWHAIMEDCNRDQVYADIAEWMMTKSSNQKS